MREVNPMDTDRAVSWQLYIDAPMPMVTIFKTLNITNLMKRRAEGYKLNMLLCFCILQAAQDTKEFRLLPVGKKMMEYDEIGVNVIVKNQDSGINSCDLPFTQTLEEFNRSYLELTEQVRRLRNNRPYDNRNVQSGKIRHRRRGEHVQRNFQ